MNVGKDRERGTRETEIYRPLDGVLMPHKIDRVFSGFGLPRGNEVGLPMRRGCQTLRSFAQGQN